MIAVFFFLYLSVAQEVVVSTAEERNRRQLLKVCRQ